VNASGASTYQWLENGLVLTGATAVTYTVPDNTPEGVYTYIRQAKSADCSEWQSSNEFTLTVFACSFTAGTETGATATFTDPRDGKQYKTVVMPDDRTWFAQNLNYTKDLTFNAYAREANGKLFTTPGYAAIAIGSYWCPGVTGSTYSGDQNMCNIYGALYTWETTMMVDGKYADETKTSNAWDPSWVSPYYYNSGAPNSSPNADRNNGRGGTNVKGGGRGICPMGWHIPTVLEWATLLDNVEGNTTFTNSNLDVNTWLGAVAGKKLKSSAIYTDTNSALTGAWFNDPIPGTDDYGFCAVPAGGRSSAAVMNGIGTTMRTHTSCLRSAIYSLYISLTRNRASALISSNTQAWASSVRCIKD
jgi:uncharacterized protein (TIGR02145 family)